VTEEQYQEFYKSIAHQVDKPFMVLHNKAEGKIEYANLLFIPTVKPFDLFHPDRIRRVKLYVKRVFIAEENIEVIPRYLRFIRGVVDSEDLPLNISRETLQANPLVDKIRKSITSKILSELKKKSEKEPEEYNKFWLNFGAVIKEGLCEVLDTKDEILSICKFYSSRDDKLTSIDDYISRMKPDQQDIYYLSGENLDALRNSPQIEGLVKNGYEILFFTDTVDDFWVNVAYDYKGKHFKSATRSDIALDDIEKVAENSEIDPLIALFKNELGDKVKDVRISKKLESSPVCLAIGEGDMDMRMERFLRDQKQLPQGTTAKILEINPNHQLIKHLAEKGETQEVRDSIHLLFEQALILEGESLPDLRGFSERFNQFLEKALAA
jgi:molecular chaperone HtpG